MEFDGSFVLAGLGPRENRKTKIDRGGIEGINRLLQLGAKVFVGIKTSGLGNQDLGEVGVDTPIADMVGVSQGIARHFSSKAHMIEFLWIATEAGLDVWKVFAISELSKGHAKELIPAGKGFDFVVALIPFDELAKLIDR